MRFLLDPNDWFGRHQRVTLLIIATLIVVVGSE